MKKNSVSIVIITFNNYRQFRETFEKVKNTEYDNIEYIIIDNSTQKESLEDLRLKNVKIINSKKNLGWSGGCNLGFKYCENEYILFLNDDIWPKDKLWLKNLVSNYRNCNNNYIFAPLIVTKEKDGELYYAEYKFNKTFYSRRLIKKPYHNLLPKFIKLNESGIFLIHRDKFLRIGKWNQEIYFLYHEDVEFGLRSRECFNQKIFAVTNSVLITQGEGSVRKNYSDFEKQRFLRTELYSNALKTILLHFSFKHYVVAIPKELLKIFILSVYKKDFKLLYRIYKKLSKEKKIIKKYRKKYMFLKRDFARHK